MPEEESHFTLVASASSFALLAAYYIFNVAQKPKIHTSSRVYRKFLDDHVPSLKNKYWPSWFSWEGRLQSALGLNLRICEKLPYRRDILQLKDGGQLAVDFLSEKVNFLGEKEKSDEDAHDDDDDRLVVLLLPGLTSSSNTSYVKTLAMTIVNAGAIVAVLNNRGLGGIALKTPRTYCATNNEDVREVIAHLKSKYPKSKFLAIGTSLGGMTLSRYLINWPQEAKETFVCAMVISICWDPMIGNRSLESGLVNKYIVNYTLTTNLQNLAKRHLSMLESRANCWDFEKVFSVKTIREFDDHFTAPQFGYSSWEEYYRAAQITPDIHKFSIPVFGLNAIDDPMQPGEDLPIKETEMPGSNLTMIVTTKGGHLGFLDHPIPIRRPFHWLERVVGEFVNAIKLHAEDLTMQDSCKMENLTTEQVLLTEENSETKLIASEIISA